MAKTYFHGDTPPQEFLDGLKKINVPRIYDPGISSDQRKNLISLVRKRLKEWLQVIREQIKKIKDRYSDGGNSDELILVLAPYEKLEAFGLELNQAVNNLEQTLKAGRVLPKGFKVEERIFGTLEWGEWYFGSPKDAARWDEFVRIKNRLDGVRADLIPMTREFKLVMARLKQHKDDLNILMRRYRQLKNGLLLGLQTLFVLLIVAGCLWVGTLIFNRTQPLSDVLSNDVTGGILMILGVVGAIMSIVFWRRRRKALNLLKEEIIVLRREVKIAQSEAKKQRLAYYPVDKLNKELTAQYRQLRETFK